MSMFGWDLPPGVTDAMIDAQCGGNHHAACPADEDAEPRYTECGGVGRCQCLDRGVQQGWWGWLRMWFVAGMWWAGPCPVDTDPPCECADIADNDEASRADAAEDARNCW